VALNEARKKAVAAIKAGQIQHQARASIDVKNLLATGAVTVDDAILVINACKGSGYAMSPHDQIKDIDVHVFKSKVQIASEFSKSEWYVKLYFLEPDVWFISMHK
jgi:hypothetical protein